MRTSPVRHVTCETTMHARRLIAPTLAALALTVAACGFLEPEPVPASVGPRPDAPTAQPTDPTDDAPTDEPVPGERVEIFGFVQAVDASGFPATVTFDEAAMYTGDEAVEAFTADHGQPPEDGLPNDYYIANPQPDIVALPTVGNVAVSVVVGSGSMDLLGAEAWADHVDPDADGEEVLFAPYHLVVVDGEIVEAREQYLP